MLVHWVRSEGNCLAISNICEMHPIEEKNSILFEVRSLLSRVSDLENENKQSDLIKMNDHAFNIIENIDYSKIKLREINEDDLDVSKFKESFKFKSN